MKFKNLSDYTKKSLSSALTKIQYFDARRWGKEAEDIRDKDQRWFDVVAKKNKRPDRVAFYSRDINDDQFAALVRRGFNPEEVKVLKAWKAAEILTNYIFLHEDDWEFIDAFEAWLKDTQSQGTLYMETYETAKARREKARRAVDTKATVKELKIAKRPSDVEDDDVFRAMAALHPEVREMLEGLITHGFNLDYFRRDWTTSVLFSDDPEPEAFALAVKGLRDLLAGCESERNRKTG